MSRILIETPKHNFSTLCNKVHNIEYLDFGMAHDRCKHIFQKTLLKQENIETATDYVAFYSLFNERNNSVFSMKTKQQFLDEYSKVKDKETILGLMSRAGSITTRRVSTMTRKQSTINSELFRPYFGRNQLPFEEDYTKVLEWLYSVSKREIFNLDISGNIWYEMVGLGYQTLIKCSTVNHSELETHSPDVLLEGDEALNAFKVTATLPLWKSPKLDQKYDSGLIAKPIEKPKHKKKKRENQSEIDNFYEIIQNSGVVGVSYKALNSIKTILPSDKIISHLLDDAKIHEVGFSEHRYVSKENIAPWTIQTQKIKFRPEKEKSNSKEVLDMSIEIKDEKNLLKVSHSDFARNTKPGKYEARSAPNEMDVGSEKELKSAIRSFPSLAELEVGDHIEVENVTLRPRVWQKVSGDIEFNLMSKYVHGIFIAIQQQPGITGRF